MTQKKQPLAYRMRPRNLDEFIGQREIVDKDKILYKMIEVDKITSLIFYGPPGTGKTTLARIIAKTTEANFEKINAVTAGVGDIKRIIQDTTNEILNKAGKTVLFIDEIHRFNKLQQDALLPHVENGTIVLIGATTENPFFEVNKALISRSMVFMLKPLSEEDIKKIIEITLKDKERGLGEYNIDIKDDALEYLSSISNGDARMALNTLEIIIATSNIGEKNQIAIDYEKVYECIQKRYIRYDKSSDAHYDNISAFIKSMRGSDPDAAVFYLARAIYAGESPDFLARRIIICASEDVGIANPVALQTAVAAAEAVRMIGMPEGRIILSQAAIMVAVSPKSNASYMAINKALDDIKNKNTGEVPMHIRNANNKGMKNLGYGKGYKYAHDYESNYTKQEYFPKEMEGTLYYNPTINGYEARISEWLKRIRE